MTDQSLAPDVTRRNWLAGAAFGGAAAVLPAWGWAQTAAQTAPDGFQVLHANGPGHTLRLIRGEEVRVRLFNDTTEPAAIHWHGVRLPKIGRAHV